MSVTAGILGATGLASSAIGAFGASSAANKQTQAAEQAASLQHQDAQAALDFQKQQYGNSLQMLNPYLQRGYQGLGLLSYGLGLPGQNAPGFSLSSLNPSSLSPGGNFNASTINANRLRLLEDGTLGASAGGRIAPLQGDSFTADSAIAPRTDNQRFLGPPTSASGGPFSFGGGGFGFNGTPPGTSGVQTADGGPLQVPRTDGGGGTNGAPAGGTDANGNPNLSFGSLLAPFTEQFHAPTVTDDPGYQFRLEQGMNALNNSAAARGNLLSGGFAKELNDYAQGSASQEYQNAYNRSLDQYLNRANLYFQNQNSQFNKLADISGMGQTAGNQLSASGLTAGNQIGNTLLTSGAQIGNDLQNAGAARASGIAGSTNAISGGLSSLGNLALLSKLLGGSSGGGGGSFTFDPFAGSFTT